MFRELLRCGGTEDRAPERRPLGHRAVNDVHREVGIIGRGVSWPGRRLILVPDPDTADQLRRAEIPHRHPRTDLPTLRIFLQHRTLPSTCSKQH